MRNALRSMVREVDDRLAQETERQEKQFQSVARPEAISVCTQDNGTSPPENKIAGTITGFAFLGRTVRFEVQLRDGRLLTVARPKHQALALNLDMERQVSVALGNGNVFPS